jgi:hypothetical protein
MERRPHADPDWESNDAAGPLEEWSGEGGKYESVARGLFHSQVREVSDVITKDVSL